MTGVHSLYLRQLVVLSTSTLGISLHFTGVPRPYTGRPKAFKAAGASAQ